MANLSCDVAIIGAGTAGLAAERAARKGGAKTLLIDDRFAGTTCASVGCMPSKLLIAAANAAFNARRASLFGIQTQTSVDDRAVMARVRKERDKFVAATLRSIERIPDGIRLQQRARFTSRNTLELADGTNVSAKAIVVATGSRPSVPEPFQKLGDIVLTNDTIFELSSLPMSIAVVGAGPLGLELAQALTRLESKRRCSIRANISPHCTTPKLPPNFDPCSARNSRFIWASSWRSQSVGGKHSFRGRAPPRESHLFNASWSLRDGRQR